MATIVYAHDSSTGKVTRTTVNPLDTSRSHGVSVYSHDSSTGKVKENKN